MKKPFKLKSGNISGGSSFKAMGATPGESPAKILGFLRFGWNALTKGKKIKRAVTATTKKKDAMFNKKTGKLKKDKNKTDVENVIKESADNAIAKKSLEYGGKTQAAKDALTAATVIGGYKYMKNVNIPEVEVKDKYTGNDDELIQKFKDRETKKDTTDL